MNIDCMYRGNLSVFYSPQGALKAAHVGVSIVNDPAFERRIEGNKKEKGGKGSTAKDRMVRELGKQESHVVMTSVLSTAIVIGSRDDRAARTRAGPDLGEARRRFYCIAIHMSTHLCGLCALGHQTRTMHFGHHHTG